MAYDTTLRLALRKAGYTHEQATEILLHPDDIVSNFRLGAILRTFLNENSSTVRESDLEVILADGLAIFESIPAQDDEYDDDLVEPPSSSLWDDLPTTREPVEAPSDDERAQKANFLKSWNHMITNGPAAGDESASEEDTDEDDDDEPFSEY